MGDVGQRGSRDLGDADAELRPGTVLSKYRIVSLIRRGGMGAVYRVRHVDLGVPFALKTLSPDLARDPKARERFLREAQASSQIRHPHVVNVSHYGTARGIPFFIMDCLEGEDLGGILARRVLTAEQTANLMLPICSAIAETHEKRFVHRDLKPSNIFLHRNAVNRIVPMLLDFGVAKSLDLDPEQGLTKDGAIVGTPHYVSPEQLSNLPATGRSDQYALGVILYQCVTGHLPFEGGTTTVLDAIPLHDFPLPRALRPDLPAAFERLILKAMSARRGDRFDSVRALGGALLAFASPPHRNEWTGYFSGVQPLGSLSMAIALDVASGWRRPRITTPSRSIRSLMAIAAGLVIITALGLRLFRHASRAEPAGLSEAAPYVAVTPRTRPASLPPIAAQGAAVPAQRLLPPAQEGSPASGASPESGHKSRANVARVRAANRPTSGYPDNYSHAGVSLAKPRYSTAHEP
jgi:serine/threonine protein kinase